MPHSPKSFRLNIRQALYQFKVKERKNLRAFDFFLNKYIFNEKIRFLISVGEKFSQTLQL